MDGSDLNFNELVTLFGLPTRPELLREGKNLDLDTYRRVAVKIAGAHLAPYLLQIISRDGESYRLQPMAGYGWRDVAYMMSHAYNLRQGREELRGLDDFLELAPGEEPYADFRAAVLDNLGLAADSKPMAAKAMHKVIDDMLAVKEELAKLSA